METPELSESQQQSLNEACGRGVAFEEMIRTKGWEWVLAFYQAQIQSLANDLILSNDDISTFEGRRNEIKGLRKLIENINSDIQTLTNERSKERTKQKKA